MNATCSDCAARYRLELERQHVSGEFRVRYPTPDCDQRNPWCAVYDVILSRLSRQHTVDSTEDGAPISSGSYMAAVANKLADIRDEMRAKREVVHRPPPTHACRDCDDLGCEVRWYPSADERRAGCRGTQNRREARRHGEHDPRTGPEERHD